jgi:hypothetical protein
MNRVANYRKKKVQAMYPWTPDTDMTGVSVNHVDVLEEGGMIALNPADNRDRWYVSKQFFSENYEAA